MFQVAILAMVCKIMILLNSYLNKGIIFSNHIFIYQLLDTYLEVENKNVSIY